jgi:hypothetical protein
MIAMMRVTLAAGLHLSLSHAAVQRLHHYDTLRLRYVHSSTDIIIYFKVRYNDQTY